MFGNTAQLPDVKSNEKASEMSRYDKIIYESTPEELDYACRLNKGLAAFCKSHPEDVGITMIKKYKVDYTDRGNLIYMDINFDDIYNSETCVYDIEKIYKLFLKYYNLEEINCSGKGITSLPRLPKLKILNCSNNDIKSIPIGLKELKILDCSNNELTELFGIPKLEELICWDNQFDKFPGLGTLSIKNTHWCNYIEYLTFPKLKKFNDGDYLEQLKIQFNKIQRNLDGL